MIDPKSRFSNRVENYVRFRPRYPPEVIGLLERACGLTAASRIADVGSGTGILSELFLANGNEVIGIEPNPEMRAAAETLLAGEPRFTSVAGSAEATGLEDSAVDLVVAGQAFHWFDPRPTRREFRRVLRPGGHVVLIWNDRKVDSTPFLAEYESLLHRHGTDYGRVQHRTSKAQEVDAFFEPGGHHVASFPNRQELDHDALLGRVLSSSYVPERGQPGHEALIEALEALFKKHQHDGRVTFEYDTKVFWGRLE